MDRLIHTALNSVANLRDARIAQAQNMANLNVPGFRRDIASGGQAVFVLSEDGQSARAVQTEQGPLLFSSAPGMMQETGDAMDIAIAEDGYFLVQPDGGGEPALSRRGDLGLNGQGQLVNGAGDLMLSTALQPITLPPHARMVIDELGQILVQPRGGGEMTPVAMLGTSTAQGLTLAKGPDGQIRDTQGRPLAADQGARVRQGVLEGSNVDPVTEMVNMIELQRSFELSLKLVENARDLDESASRLMRLPD